MCARELKNQNFSVCHITFCVALNHQILRTADYYQGFTSNEPCDYLT